MNSSFKKSQPRPRLLVSFGQGLSGLVALGALRVPNLEKWEARGARGGAGLLPRLRVGGLAQHDGYLTGGQTNSSQKKSPEGQWSRGTDRMVPEEPSRIGTRREYSGKCQGGHREPDRRLRICTWISAFTSRSNLTISWLQIRTWTSWGAAMLEMRLRRAAAAKLERVHVPAFPYFSKCDAAGDPVWIKPGLQSRPETFPVT